MQHKWTAGPGENCQVAESTYSPCVSFRCPLLLILPLLHACFLLPLPLLRGPPMAPPPRFSSLGSVLLSHTPVLSLPAAFHDLWCSGYFHKCYFICSFEWQRRQLLCSPFKKRGNWGSVSWVTAHLVLGCAHVPFSDSRSCALPSTAWISTSLWVPLLSSVANRATVLTVLPLQWSSLVDVQFEVSDREWLISSTLMWVGCSSDQPFTSYTFLLYIRLSSLSQRTKQI